jgi:glycosyltransferase involved in cell wall biosynthesis
MTPLLSQPRHHPGQRPTAAPSALRLSVVLCTYNGSMFLPGQLASLLSQSRLPDELVAFDDGSSDGTVAQLRSFAQRAPFPVSIRVNPARLGPAQNFGHAIAAATGDIIVLCDQDDLWLRHRLAAAEQAFLANPHLGFTFADADMCDAAGHALGYRLWQSLPFPRSARRRLEHPAASPDSAASPAAFDTILRQNIVTGATLAFAARFRPLVLPIDPQWMHDGWIALLIAAVAPVAAIDQPLIRYRQHARQTVGARRRSLYQQYLAARQMDRDVFLNHAKMYQAALDRLTNGAPASVAVAVARQHLEEKVQHYRRRSAMRRRECPRLVPSLIELLTLRYRRFSLGWKSFAQDLFL